MTFSELQSSRITPGRIKQLKLEPAICRLAEVTTNTYRVLAKFQFMVIVY